MKIKADFVTNSSSSSFVVMGSDIDISKISEEYIKAVMKESESDTEELKLDPKVDDHLILIDEYDLIERFLQGSDLTYSFGEPYSFDQNNVMVGIPYTRMGEDETLKQFKTRTQLLILEKFGLQTKPGHIEKCWMDN